MRENTNDKSTVRLKRRLQFLVRFFILTIAGIMIIALLAGLVKEVWEFIPVARENPKDALVGAGIAFGALGFTFGFAALAQWAFKTN